MPEIILTAQQAKVLLNAKENVILRDEAGTVRIVSEPYDAIALANQYRRKESGETSGGMSSEKLDEFMKLLAAEQERMGRIEPTRVREMLAEFRAKEAA